MVDQIVDVVAGVLLRPDGSYFLASRPEGKVYAGYWEFPGGKVERDETRYAALVRELQEELGIDVKHATPWLTQVFTYPHATVRLNFFLVDQWLGEPHPKEGQQFAWQQPGLLTVDPVLPANTPIFRALSLPQCYAITNVAELGVDVQLQRLDQALAGGLRLIQIREKQLEGADWLIFARSVVTRAHARGAKVMVNGTTEQAKACGADGVHLSTAALMALQERPAMVWVGASCHCLTDLQHAKQLGVDYALLGSVLPTKSHPGGSTLGWAGFQALHQVGWSFPLYALGGMQPSDQTVAAEHGAHGIAMQRQVW
ncbi:Nudix family hydrolase [Chitinivorax sp. B]|uniref:Nudix family hydrolase n=1 Tax=Chitinivorax sp. B TaxID=2502235 RepID=UPI0010F8E5DE|nr:Nudix family hydrolase [Chitinivorax sp. B]